MGLQIGIVGLPNVGKSTLFNALTRSKKANTANYPFCTIDPNVGVVSVPDPRLEKLASLVQPKRIIPATVEFVDIAGLIRGASKGEGLGNQFLAAIRECDAIAEVVRVFEDENISHVHQTVDPKRDIEIIQMELILADLQTVEKRLEKAGAEAKSGDKEKIAMHELLKKLKKTLGEGKRALEASLSEEEQYLSRELHLLTQKAILAIANIDEKEISKITEQNLREKLGLSNDSEVIPISAKIEEELGGLSEEESKMFLEELGMKESGLDHLIRSAYRTLNLITFFTAGPKEVRSWTIQKGAKAPQAAGVIHTDFEKGFIAAEVIAYDDYITSGSEASAKEKGEMRLEGRDYVVQDGDVMHFRFHV